MQRLLFLSLILVAPSCAQKTVVKGQDASGGVIAQPTPCQCQVMEKAQVIEERFLGSSDLIPASQIKTKTEKQKRLQRRGYVYIVTVPENATVFLDGVEVGKGAVFKAIEGNRFRHVSVRAEGYHELEGYLEVFEDEVIKFKLALEPIGGSLTVLTTPIGAKVLLDDEPKGLSPITIKPVPIGKHVVTVSQGDTVTTREVVIAEGETKVLEFDLSQKPSREPEPKGAQGFEKMPVAQKSEETPSASLPEKSQTGVVSPLEGQQQATQQVVKPDCQAVCNKLRSVLQSPSIREVLVGKCKQRCDEGDLRFAICIWKAQNTEDAQKCFTLQGQ